MKFKALLLSLFLFIPVKVAASEKPMMTSEAVRSITLLGLNRYSQSYCEYRDAGSTHAQADLIALDQATERMFWMASKYELGTEAIFQEENQEPMLIAMSTLAKRRCSEYF